MAQTRKQVRRQQHEEASARNAAARAAAVRAQRRTKAAKVGGIVAAVAAVGAAIALPLALRTGSGLPHPKPAERAVAPPWGAPAHPLADAQAAGLRTNQMETLAEHFHAHLDILVDGKPVVVPANLGIDSSSGSLAEVHTHDATGVVHIEAPDTKHRYVLGQLFAEWDVRLDSTHLGALTTGSGNTLTAYVDGKKVSGNPAEIELKAHREIALVYGPAGQKVDVPTSYSFPAGE